MKFLFGLVTFNLRLALGPAIHSFFDPISATILATAILGGAGLQANQASKQRKQTEKQIEKQEQEAQRMADKEKANKATGRARRDAITSRRGALLRQGRLKSLATPKGGTLLTAGQDTSQSLLGGGPAQFKTLLGQ